MLLFLAHFMQSMTEEFFTNVREVGLINPIFKFNNLTDVTNYRPISIICHIVNIFESIINT